MGSCSCLTASAGSALDATWRGLFNKGLTAAGLAVVHFMHTIRLRMTSA